jgi:hypothetical protein
MSKRFVPALALIALCLSCQKFAEGRQMFRELLALRDQITAEFHEKDVDVNLLNGDRMSVKFINSPLALRSRDEKQKRADDVAAFVTAHYKHPLARVMSVFVQQAGGAGVSVSTSEAFVGRPAAPKP